MASQNKNIKVAKRLDVLGKNIWYVSQRYRYFSPRILFIFHPNPLGWSDHVLCHVSYRVEFGALNAQYNPVNVGQVWLEIYLFVLKLIFDYRYKLYISEINIFYLFIYIGFSRL